MKVGLSIISKNGILLTNIVKEMASTGAKKPNSSSKGGGKKKEVKKEKETGLGLFGGRFLPNRAQNRDDMICNKMSRTISASILVTQNCFPLCFNLMCGCLVGSIWLLKIVFICSLI